MDPLSLTASIIAVLQLTSTLTSYINNARNATKDQAKLAVEASNLYSLLTTLRFRVEEAHSDDRWFNQIKLLGSENGPLDQFKDILKTMVTQLSTSGKRDQIKSMLLWKFTKKEVETTLMQMERLKSLGYVAVSGGGDDVLSDRRLADPKDRVQVYELVSDALDDSQHGRYMESIQKLHEAGRIEKDSLPVHYLLALNCFRQHDFQTAIDEFQITLKLSPDYTLANYYLGLAYVQTGAWDPAIAAFRKTLELDGTNYSAAYNLGAAYLKEERVTDAEAAFRQAVKINSRYAQAHEALGELLIYQNKLDEGIASLRAALEIEPNYPTARQALIKALQANGQDREAEEELRKGAGGSSRP